MTDDNSQKKSTETSIPDWTEMWKEAYFKTEQSMSDAWKEFIATEPFIKTLNQTIEQYLDYKQIAQKNLENVTDVSGLATKKDIARLAELLISIEEKTDQLDSVLNNTNKLLSESLTKILETGSKAERELKLCQQRLDAWEEKLAALQPESPAVSNVNQPKPRSPRAKKTAAEKEPKKS